MPIPMLVCKYERDSNGDTYPVYFPSSQKMLNQYHDKVENKTCRQGLHGLTDEKTRSIEQNNYYWGVVLEYIAQHLGHIGPGEKNDLHNQFRSMFLVYIGPLGEPCVQSTQNLDTKLFEKYLEAVRTWALQTYQIAIPLPNETEKADESKTYRNL